MIAITQIQFDEDLRQSGIGRVFRAMDRCRDCGGGLVYKGFSYEDQYEQHTCNRCGLSELRLVKEVGW